ncbi:DUF485 domain-containing protein [Actinomadura roseirufa]|uniref:DUF485 domain-containing protein n=1 Tax=Actinomadura roseirufa TaxID=2094049 RepID=UPI001041A474|nr:DUF485 domain-containing protein [Actinomadura roseirufa]
MGRDAEPSRRRTGERGGSAPPGHYAPVAADERFLLLRRRFLRLSIGIAGPVLGTYFGYVALSAFGRGLMARRVAGDVNVALLLGLLQFASTFLMAGLYVAYARRRLDPLAAELRAGIEGGRAPRSRRAERRRAEHRRADQHRAEHRRTDQNRAADRGRAEHRRTGGEPSRRDPTELGPSGMGSSEIGPLGFGPSGLGSSGLGSSEMGPSGLGSLGLGPLGRGRAGIESSGLGPSEVRSSEIGSPEVRKPEIRLSEVRSFESGAPEDGPARNEPPERGRAPRAGDRRDGWPGAVRPDLGGLR